MNDCQLGHINDVSCYLALRVAFLSRTHESVGHQFVLVFHDDEHMRPGIGHRLGGFPRLLRLKTLLLTNNKIS